MKTIYKANSDIRLELERCNLTYSDILEFIPNFSHINRISEELAKPLSEERKKVYLLAIKKAKQKKLDILSKIYNE